MGGVSFSSQIVVNKDTQELGGIDLNNIFVILKSGIGLLLYLFKKKKKEEIMKLVLSIFNESLFSLNQLVIFFNSLLISFSNWTGSS